MYMGHYNKKHLTSTFNTKNLFSTKSHSLTLTGLAIIQKVEASVTGTIVRALAVLTVVCAAPIVV